MKTGNVRRSPLFYVGDKYKLINEIKQFFPTKIRHFIEPFVGGGSVFLNVDAKDYFLNDIDSNVINLHKFLLSYINKEDDFFTEIWEIIDYYGLSCSAREDRVPESLKLQYVKTYFAKFNKKGFEKLRNDFNSSGHDNFMLLYVLLIYGFNRMLRFNRNGNYNLPVGNVDFNPNTVLALKSYFEVNREKESNWYCTDFEDFIKNLDLNNKDFIYLDPPYLITFSEYNKLWNEDTELRLLNLLDALSDCNIKFAISNVSHYKGKINEIFLNWSKKYITHPIKSNYISYHDNSIKNFSEVLITNY